MVSILVPVYNAALYLKECVDSLIGQTHTDLQIVMIDDGSTDGSWDILCELAHRDKRIEVYSQPNCGVATTRNRLLDKAKGEFILFVDSDDWIELNTLEILLREQEVGNFDIVAYQLSTPLPQDEVYNQEQVVMHFLEHTVFRGSLCNKLIRRELFDGLQFDQTVSYGEDALMVWQVLQRVKNVKVLGQVLYHYRDNPNSISRKKFDGKKFTEYTVWDSISGDVAALWPQFSEIANARFACQMTQVLMSAALGGYPHNQGIKLLQEVVRHHRHLIKKTGISSIKMSLYAWLISHNYWLACKMSRFLL